jgi:hypothetical protein
VTEDNRNTGWRNATPVQQGLGCLLMAGAISLILLALGLLAWLGVGAT